jgi:hypothetical protein
MAWIGDGRGTLSVRTAAPAARCGPQTGPVRVPGRKVLTMVPDEPLLPIREHLPRLTVFDQFLSSTVSSCQFPGVLTTFGPIAPSC